ncbi:sigma-70 family RNA polymerase sigma factor [Amycolatopsis taiwanensis]|uniref:RNA polymerase sigma factor n=1 Tax=Amycolatopsis taiwanensis TaxID=342230 RepID=A0A9W6VCZ3_9PSEU|nr:sigma-70 family RNA polymerase sigma factor [Amycolatopsis taiwanensis]GLY64265.1 RNA polymerase sigma factor [Amycolatopsis taiwanensis]
MSVSTDYDSKSDTELISEVRSGTLDAYGTLYQRHVHAAHNLARQLTRSPAEADDLVAEAFAKVLDALRGGKGPEDGFRAYLLTTLRHTAYRRGRRAQRVDLSADMTVVSGATGAAAEALTVPFTDTAVEGLERSMAARAFARLPERWQTVLWHTVIEQQKPAEVAPILGLKANGVSALAFRAREALRQEYLRMHLAEISDAQCRGVMDRLGAWVREGLRKRERAQVELHLDECERCAALAMELRDVNETLRVVVAPIVLGGAAVGYLAATAAGAATTGAAAAGAGGAAGAASSVPRQMLSVGVGGTAIAAAIVLALTVTGGQDIPTASAPAAVPDSTTPEPPVQPPQSTAPGQTTPQPPPAPPVTPGPGPAASHITAFAVADEVELEPGGGPAVLPVKVRNDGGAMSGPVTATLKLPPGIRAVGPGGGSGTAAGYGTFAAAAADAGSAPDVDCPAGTGTVSCTTLRGLQPGESATLTFRLIAGPDAQPGTVAASVNAGTSNPIALVVPVRVAAKPDAVQLAVDADWLGSPHLPSPGVVNINVRNTGPNAKPATITFDRAVHGLDSSGPVTCTARRDGTTCTTPPLAPGESLHLTLWIYVDLLDWDMRVTATLGTAEASKRVEYGCSNLPLCPMWEPSSQPAPAVRPTN